MWQLTREDLNAQRGQSNLLRGRDVGERQRDLLVNVSATRHVSLLRGLLNALCIFEEVRAVHANIRMCTWVSEEGGTGRVRAQKHDLCCHVSCVYPSHTTIASRDKNRQYADATNFTSPDSSNLLRVEIKGRIGKKGVGSGKKEKSQSHPRCDLTSD